MKNIDLVKEIAGRYYEQWEKDPSRMENGYQYESTFSEMAQKMLKEIFESSLGEIPKSRNKKKGLLPDSEI